MDLSFLEKFLNLIIRTNLNATENVVEFIFRFDDILSTK